MEHLVVGVDGSTGADRALAWAIREARSWDARLTIVHCYPTLPTGGPRLAEEEDNARRAVEKLVAAHATELDGVRWHTQVRWAPSGSWAYKLVDAAEDADLLVVGSRGLGGFWQLLLGSVSHHVSIHAPSSVAVVRGGADTGGTPSSVVVGIDGSQPSLRALTWAAREADRHGVPLEAVHAYPVPTAAANLALARSTDEAEVLRDRAHAAAEELLASAVARGDLPSRVEVRRRIAAGSPAGVLIAAAGADALLVCGQRGHGRLGQLVIGSVSDQCLRHAQGTVVVVRPTRVAI
jgi:nucleotide-binding universal stress UspA family protein